MANDPKTREVIPADEPFEMWWPKYLARVKESVDAAEQHLGVPAGTISSIPEEPDFIATVKTYAVIEPILNELIAKRPPTVFGALASQEVNANFRTFIAALNMSGSSGKLRLAAGLGLLIKFDVAFIRAVARVRHRYAHNVKNMHRSLSEILTEEQQNNGRIVEHLTGIKFELSSTRNEILKIFMYHRLADYLASLLHTLRPPPLPEGGILSGLLGLGALVKPEAAGAGKAEGK